MTIDIEHETNCYVQEILKDTDKDLNSRVVNALKYIESLATLTARHVEHDIEEAVSGMQEAYRRNWAELAENSEQLDRLIELNPTPQLEGEGATEDDHAPETVEIRGGFRMDDDPSLDSILGDDRV